MKTLHYSKYLKRLAALNDQLCFYQFSKIELEDTIRKLQPTFDLLYLPDVFKTNIMAPRINVLIKDVLSFQQQNEDVNLATYFAMSYEIFSNYLKDVMIELPNFCTNPFQQRNHNELEEKFNMTLNASGYVSIPDEIIKTIKYLRLRRNHFTHLATSVDTYTTSVITTHGTTLNAYWSGSIQNLDFTSLNILDFDNQETIELIKIIRIITDRLDNLIASGYSKNKIVQYVASKLFPHPQKLNHIIIKKRINKTRTLAKIEFDIDIDDTIIEPIVSIIAAK